MQCIFEAHKNYCWWLPKDEGLWFPPPTVNSFEINYNFNQKWVEQTTHDPKKDIKTRKRRNSVIDIDRWIENIWKCLSNRTLKLIVGRIKLRPYNFETPKGRGSNYVGVSKNGENWQVLINWGKFKKYIGTFKNEKEAAISYDFFSICLHASKAKTNFTYSSTLIAEMVESYDRNTKTFDALRFIDRV